LDGFLCFRDATPAAPCGRGGLDNEKLSSGQVPIELRSMRRIGCRRLQRLLKGVLRIECCHRYERTTALSSSQPIGPATPLDDIASLLQCLVRPALVLYTRDCQAAGSRALCKTASTST
jgi:hypothetical protein